MNRREIIAERLKAARTQAGLSQDGLAYLSGVTLKTINNTERKRTSLTIKPAMRLAKVLKCKVAWLLDLEEEDEMSEMQEG